MAAFSAVALAGWLYGGDHVDPVARADFVPFLLTCGEGRTNWLYLDSKGNVTVGVGNMLPRVEDALALEWTRRDGSLATPDDVRAAWRAVTALPSWAGRGGGTFAQLTTIRATDDSIARLIQRDVDTFEPVLRRYFDHYDDAPSPAQEGLMRMAWALGPAFAHDGAWPKFRAAWNAGQWAECAKECRIPELDATEPHANDATAALFTRAAREDVTRPDLAPDTLPAPPEPEAGLDVELSGVPDDVEPG